LFIAALAWPMLGERVGIGRLLAIVVGFAGVLVVARPSDGAFEPAAGLAVLSAAFYAVGQVLSRRLGVAAPSSVMALYQNCVFIAGGATMAAVVGSGLLGTSDHPSAAFLLRSWVVPPLTDGLLLLGGGIVAGTGAWLLTRAYAMTEVNTVAPFEYTALAWGTLWGYVLWNEIPDVWVFAGIALVLGSSFYVLRVRAPGP
jgi:drug/metabolite transporter (DMT)-like permease